MIKIIPPEAQAGPMARRGSQFSGTVNAYVTMPSTDNISINSVSFTPGARTYWHRHEVGQILQVISGRGLIQTAGGPVQVIHAGDSIWIPAGERHWHGASSETAMTHTAISLGVTTWEEEVSDADYTGAAKRG